MWLLKFLQETDGKPSMTRLLSVSAVWSVLAVFIALNVSSLIKSGGFIDLGTNALGLVLVAMGAKVAHSVFKDKSSSGADDSTQDPK